MVSFFNNYRGHFLLQRFRLSQVVTVWAVEGGEASDGIDRGRRERPQAVFFGCWEGGFPLLFDRPLYYTKLNLLHLMNRNESAFLQALGPLAIYTALYDSILIQTIVK